MENKQISGLYAVTPETLDSEWLYRQVEAALRGGARWVQYRSKDLSARRREEQAYRLAAVCAAWQAIFIVNDDVALAHEVRAAGVHLGQEDMAVAEARAVLGNRAVIGASCYDSLLRACEAQKDGADYVAFGSFFPSKVKPAAVCAPLDLLRVARTVIDLPIVAIGGITTENGRTLIDAGADALAVVSALFDVPDTCAAAQTFNDLFQVYDSPVATDFER